MEAGGDACPVLVGGGRCGDVAGDGWLLLGGCGRGDGAEAVAVVTTVTVFAVPELPQLVTSRTTLASPMSSTVLLLQASVICWTMPNWSGAVNRAAGPVTPCAEHEHPPTFGTLS